MEDNLTTDPDSGIYHNKAIGEYDYETMRLHLIGLLLLATAASGAATGAARKVVVDAGAHGRRDVVVSFDLPEGQGGEWRLRDGKSDVPLQVVGARGFFVVKELKAGATKTYTLEPGKAAAASGVEAQKEGDDIQFTQQGRPLLRYRGGKGDLPEGVAPEYRRAGYLHPVLTPAGRTVTDDLPKDHRHHHGIWFAWTKTSLDGRAPDFWNMGQKKAGIQFEALDDVWSGATHAGLRAKHRYIDMTGDTPATALWERLEVRVYPGGGTDAKAYSLFDVEVTHDRVGSTPLELPKYHYGGLGFRGAAEWKADPTLVSILTSEGKTRADGNETRARWYRVSGTVGGKPVAIVSYGHPENFRAPQPLRLNPTDPFFCWAPSQLGDWAINPGKSYISRYRFAVWDEAPEVPEIERLWKDYAEAVTVIVK
jgi:hypothetical protein